MSGDDPFGRFQPHGDFVGGGRATEESGLYGQSTHAGTDPGPAGVESAVVTATPVWPLMAAAGCVVLALVLLLFGGIPAHLVGYLSATVVCISLVLLFRTTDTITRANNADYVARPEARWIASGVLAMGMLAALPHVFALARDL